MTEPTTPDTTFTIDWEPAVGYRINTDDPDSAVLVDSELPPQAIIPAVAPDPVIPTAKQWWCVVSEEGLGTIFGPYLTEAAAQSLIDEGKATGVVQRMDLA